MRGILAGEIVEKEYMMLYEKKRQYHEQRIDRMVLTTEVLRLLGDTESQLNATLRHLFS